MKILLSKGSIAKIALLMLLSLNVFAGMTILVHAPRIKDSTVFVYGSGSVELTWKSGKSETYDSNDATGMHYYASFGGLDTVAFNPTFGWHIAAVVIDGSPVDMDALDEDGFSLSDGLPKRAVSVTFEENDGVDDVETGPNVPTYPDPGVGLIFVYVETGGWAYAYTIELQEPSPIGEFWNVYTDAVFDPGVTVILVLNLEDVLSYTEDPESLRMHTCDSVLLARSDVNWDGVVDADDVSDVANANPLEYIRPPRHACDINDDGFVNDEDVNIVNNYLGEAVWEDITLRVDVDLDNGLVYVYGVTDDLSIFWCI